MNDRLREHLRDAFVGLLLALLLLALLWFTTGGEPTFIYEAF